MAKIAKLLALVNGFSKKRLAPNFEEKKQ